MNYTLVLLSSLAEQQILDLPSSSVEIVDNEGIATTEQVVGAPPIVVEPLSNDHQETNTQEEEEGTQEPSDVTETVTYIEVTPEGQISTSMASGLTEQVVTTEQLKLGTEGVAQEVEGEGDEQLVVQTLPLPQAESSLDSDHPEVTEISPIDDYTGETPGQDDSDMDKQTK